MGQFKVQYRTSAHYQYSTCEMPLDKGGLASTAISDQHQLECWHILTSRHLELVLVRVCNIEWCTSQYIKLRGGTWCTKQVNYD